MTFTPQSIPSLDANSSAGRGTTPGAKRWEWIGAIPLGSAGPPIVARRMAAKCILSTGATFPFPGGAAGVPPLPEGVLQIDFNYDFKTDVVLAGSGGVRLLRQDSPNSFTDVTAQAKLPKAVSNAQLHGRVGGGHRSGRRSRYRAGRERGIAAGAAK